MRHFLYIVLALRARTGECRPEGSGRARRLRARSPKTVASCDITSFGFGRVTAVDNTVLVSSSHSRPSLDSSLSFVPARSVPRPLRILHLSQTDGCSVASASSVAAVRLAMTFDGRNLSKGGERGSRGRVSSRVLHRSPLLSYSSPRRTRLLTVCLSRCARKLYRNLLNGGDSCFVRHLRNLAHRLLFLARSCDARIHASNNCVRETKRLKIL